MGLACQIQKKNGHSGDKKAWHSPLGQGDVGQTFRIALEKRYVWCVTQTKRSIFSEN